MQDICPEIQDIPITWQLFNSLVSDLRPYEAYVVLKKK
jgi:hypothetical protein